MAIMGVVVANNKVIDPTHNTDTSSFIIIQLICEGKSIRCGGGGTTRVYPYDEMNPTGPKRTQDETIKQARDAVVTKSAVSKYFTQSALTILNIIGLWCKRSFLACHSASF